jgi:hypothetical protein
VRSYAPVLALCRRLVDAGIDPATPLEVWRGGVLALTVRSIGAGAGLTVADDRLGRPKFRRYTAPQSDVEDACITLPCGTDTKVGPAASYHQLRSPA